MVSQGFKVVYLTGPPATGKSTLLDHLAARVPNLLTFSYSRELAAHVGLRINSSLTEDDLRRESAKVVLPSDVVALDESLLALVREKRSTNHIVIDSHAVTKEAFGFRVTPFSRSQLEVLSPTLIICLYAEASVVLDRIEAKAQGRPKPTLFEADYHTTLQGAVAVQYGILLGKPIYFLDAAKPIADLGSEIMTWMGE
jgi:adenylate kinase